MPRSFISGLVLGSLLMATTPAIAQSPAPSPPPCVPATPTGEPVVFTGGNQNEGNTKRQPLAPGDYELVLSGVATDRSANVILKLIGPGRPDYESIWNEIQDAGPYTFSTYLYGVEGGDYHLDYNLPRGEWTVTITPA
jgi:hypothetical protein